jgi:hypothetical protein
MRCLVLELSSSIVDDVVYYRKEELCDEYTSLRVTVKYRSWARWDGGTRIRSIAVKPSWKAEKDMIGITLR